jgi:nitrite reductase (NADH) large subunit
MQYIILGNGVAGTTAAINIRKTDKQGEITIVSDEAYPFYSRIRLVDFVAGETDESGLVIYKNAWYEKNNIKLLLNTTVSDIDKEKKEIITSSADRIEYDKLLFATGGISFIPPITGVDKKGVFSLRTLKDAIGIKQYAEHAEKVVIIGGGVLGLELGNSLRKTGHKVTAVEFFPRMLPRQIDTEGAEILKIQLENMGFTLHYGAKTTEIFGKDKVEGIKLENGKMIDCDMALISAGVKANTELAEKLELKHNKGILVKDTMETDIPDIFAAGDLIEHKGMFYGIWPAAEKQGEIAGINMAGGNAVYSGTIPSNILKIAGIDLVAIGDIDLDGKLDSIIEKDKEKFIYRKLVVKDNIIVGSILLGDIKNWQKIKKSIEEKWDIDKLKKDMNGQ